MAELAYVIISQKFGEKLMNIKNTTHKSKNKL